MCLRVACLSYFLSLSWQQARRVSCRCDTNANGRVPSNLAVATKYMVGLNRAECPALSCSLCYSVSYFEITWLCQLLGSDMFVAGTMYKWISPPAADEQIVGGGTVAAEPT